MRDTPYNPATNDEGGTAFRLVVDPPSSTPALAVDSAADAPVDDDFLVLTHESFQPVPLALGPAFAPLTGFALFISRAAAINIMRHGAKGLQTEHEVAGGLVGWPGYDPETGLRYTRITAALAVHGRADQYEVEIPPEEWFRLSNLVRDEDPYRGNSLLVGWYHSHPTFDAYLSEVDQQTQRQFFGEPWNVAIVVGPLRRQIKAFHSGNSTPCALYLDPEETDGRLIEVTYEVSAGAVSTNAGVEWVEPPETMELGGPPVAADDLVFTPLPPATDGAYPNQELRYRAAPAGDSAFGPSALARLGISPVVVSLLVFVALLLFVLIVLLLLNLLRP
ncbi:MAG: Mov34/MPN/PAD-1 family protein [Chloroflexota bacterium]|nr:Mov34/MPN/PAD-1 family protein [Chloroflexota bacterium]